MEKNVVLVSTHVGCEYCGSGVLKIYRKERRLRCMQCLMLDMELTEEEVVKFTRDHAWKPAQSGKFVEALGTQEGIEWWMFWHPGSGARGGLLAGAIILCFLLLMFPSRSASARTLLPAVVFGLPVECVRLPGSKGDSGREWIRQWGDGRLPPQVPICVRASQKEKR